MSYTIFTGEDCHECAEVTAFIREQNLEIRIVNLDKDSEKPPFRLFVRPSLFKNEKLIAYGSDIIRYFSKE